MSSPPLFPTPISPPARPPPAASEHTRGAPLSVGVCGLVAD